MYLRVEFQARTLNTTGSSESAYSVYTGKSLLHLHSLFETSQDHKTLSPQEAEQRLNCSMISCDVSCVGQLRVFSLEIRGFDTLKPARN